MGAPPLLTYYGDDFTGSTDVMEVLSLAGIRTLLFLEPPSAADLARFGQPQAVGVAGTARAMTPSEMDRTLPQIFRALHDLGPQLLHYKVCSTFDSSPAIGSIGHAIDLGQRVLNSPAVPLVVGAPRLGRYCAFGNLFARSGLESPVYRLDRHPTMRVHPVTPMRESDLRCVLAEQTNRRVVLVDAPALEGGAAGVRRHVQNAEQQASGGGIILFDVLSEAHLAVIGEFLSEYALGRAPLFVAGSSGVEYALAASWRRRGGFAAPQPYAAAGPAGQILVVSGSCSPVAGAQIEFALERGFADVPVTPVDLLDSTAAHVVRARAVETTLHALEAGRSVIVHSCRGPEDPRLAGTPTRRDGSDLGRALGAILTNTLEARKVPRIVVVGGDTSSSVVRTLGAVALEMQAPLSPGSPVCTVRHPDARFDGLEIVLKGGQTGHPDFFLKAVHGGVTE